MITKLILPLLFATQLHAAAPEISGEVTLAKGATVKPGGILFVIAKKPGVAMPSAVLRVPEPKFPYKFSIGAKDAMAPGTPFDGPFTVAARYSPSGDALDKTGPESGDGKPVTVGTAGLKIEMKAK